MFSTSFLLVFIGFFLWYNTSKKAGWKNKPAYLAKLESRPQFSKLLCATLFIIATGLFVYYLGWMSGIFIAIVSIMTAGSLLVAIFPFRYLNYKSILAVYAVCLLFEFFI
ncbi:hypothetical protein ACR79S_18370 [Sphingobacterium spiritivorum]|uniref:hypothetical protein n=1 Tax=Sphingobacterium spiritivorum TaxID=258 RepID=UPI003DA3AA77